MLKFLPKNHAGLLEIRRAGYKFSGAKSLLHGGSGAAADQICNQEAISYENIRKRCGS
jgi:hypothetical protein